MLHYLRIAVTALSLTTCVLLIAMWVRSYGRVEKLLWTYQSPKAVRIIWSAGRIQAETATDDPIEITSSALGTFDWREPTFNSAPLPVETRYSLDFALHSLDADKSVPIGFPILFAATLAALPWLRCRFSLRTLLIATTLVAVALGIVVVAS
jgi:hypothetical protein